MNIDELIESLEQKITDLAELAGQNQSSTRSNLTPSQQIDHLQLNFNRLQNDHPFVPGDIVTPNPYNNIYRHNEGDPAIVARTYVTSYMVAEGHAMLPHDMIIGIVQDNGNIIYYQVHSSYFIPFNQKK